jgi:hypothetical protein
MGAHMMVAIFRVNVAQWPQAQSRNSKGALP